VRERRGTTRGRLAPALVILAALAAAAAWVVASRVHTLPEAPLARVPRGAQIVLHVDVDALRRSEVYRALVEEDRDDGLSRVRETCGFDPLGRVREVTVFATADSRDSLRVDAASPRRRRGIGSLGWVARGDRLRDPALTDCVRRVVESDGGDIVHTQVAGVPAIGSAHGPSRAAFVATDGAAGGDVRVTEAVVRVVRDRAPSALGDAELMSLWRVVAGEPASNGPLGRGGSGGEASGATAAPWSGPAVILVARLPEAWREAVARQALRHPALAFATHVRAIGASIRAGADLSLRAALRTGGASEAASLVAALSALREEALTRPFSRLLPLGRALSALRFDTRAQDVSVGVDLSVEQARALGPLLRAVARGIAGDPEARATTGGGAAQSTDDRSDAGRAAPRPDVVIRR
jgi:hypothetical protein